MAKKKPDVVDTEPPDEARPDTTATPLLVENGKVSPDVEFTPTQLLKVFEYLADKHNKPRLLAPGETHKGHKTRFSDL